MRKKHKDILIAVGVGIFILIWTCIGIGPYQRFKEKLTDLLYNVSDKVAIPPAWFLLAIFLWLAYSDRKQVSFSKKGIRFKEGMLVSYKFVVVGVWFAIAICLWVIFFAKGGAL